MALEGKQVKPIKWIGTQRSAFTHRKDNAKFRIKNLIVKLKRARDNHEEMKQRKALEKEVLPTVIKDEAMARPD